MASRTLENAARIAFGAAAPLALLVSLTLKVKATGAVPGDEFHPAGVLYDGLPVMIPLAQGVCLIAALLIGLRAGRSPGRGRVGIGAAVALGVAPWHVAVTAPGVVIAIALRSWANAARKGQVEEPEIAASREDLGGALGGLGAGALFRWWAVLALLSGAGALAVTLAESFVYTGRFAPELFRTSALLPYRFRLLELAAHYGVGIGLAYLAPVAIVTWRARRRPGRGPHLLATVVSATMIIYLAAATAVHVGDEVLETGVAPETVAYLLLLFVWWQYVTCRALSDGDYRLPGNVVPSPPRIWAVAVLAPLLVPTSWLGRRLSNRLREQPATLFRLGVLTAAVWLGVLVYTSYPELEDFRSEFIVIGVITAVHVLTLLLVALVFSVRSSARPISKRLLAVGLAIGGILLLTGLRPLRGDVALMLHEYSRFGYVVKKTSFREFVAGWSHLGTRPVDEELPVHGPTEGYYPKQVPAALNARPHPIIFVLWDAARPDRMGCYGHDRDTTPHADEFAKSAVIFERAYSQATATSCGVRNIMTGRYSTRYMLEKNHDPFFVHALRRLGYDRILVTAFGSDFNGVSIEAFRRNGPAPETDGARFDHLTKHPQGLDRERPDEVKAQNMEDAWRKVVAEKGSLDGTFSWLHLTGAHFPWWNHDPIKDFGRDNRALYDGELAKVDALTGRAFETLKELGVYDDAIIVLLADHGTGLMEHGRWAGFLPYEEQVRIPLVVKAPGIAPRRVAAPVAAIDLAPTMVGLFEPGERNAYDGVSLLPLMTGTRSKLERRWFVSLCSFEDAYAIFEDGRWKMHLHRAEGYALLFDLAADPLERNNLYDEEPEVAQRLLDKMDAWLWTGRRGYANPYHYRDWWPPDG
ncbi:MAG: hypothetical protein CMJ83_15485 [Planctomycetes bacterium]|nr:hypothetical protein [Planctomycetota bacterium]